MTFSKDTLRLSLAVALIAASVPAYAQFGNIFGNSPPPRPPGAVGNQPEQIYEDEEDVPDLPPQGRVLPTPVRPQQQQPPGSVARPGGPIQIQPLAPPPGSTAAPAPGSQPTPGLASAPAGQQKQLPRNVPGVPPTLQPGDEVVTEPPGVKITNKQATFSGLDKITGRIISFDADIGETVQFGALRVTPRVCYTRPPTEAANTDVFIEVDEITLKGEVKRLFGGWMFAASPGLHAIEHPIYDVWLTDCKGPEQTIAATQPEPTRPAAPQKRTTPQTAQQPGAQPQAPRPQRPAPLPGPGPTPLPPFAR